MPEDDPTQTEPPATPYGRHWTSSASPGQKIALVVFGIVALGLIVILGVASLVVGSVVLVVLAIAWGVMRVIASIRGERSQTDALRENVRVIRKDSDA